MRILHLFWYQIKEGSRPDRKDKGFRFSTNGEQILISKEKTSLPLHLKKFISQNRSRQKWISIKCYTQFWCGKGMEPDLQWYVAMVPRLFLWQKHAWPRLEMLEIAIVLTFPSSHLAMNWIGCSSKWLVNFQFHIRIIGGGDSRSFLQEGESALHRLAGCRPCGRSKFPVL